LHDPALLANLTLPSSFLEEAKAEFDQHEELLAFTRTLEVWVENPEGGRSDGFGLDLQVTVTRRSTEDGHLLLANRYNATWTASEWGGIPNPLAPDGLHLCGSFNLDL
jgi:hypothetical protein